LLKWTKKKYVFFCNCGNGMYPLKLILNIYNIFLLYILYIVKKLVNIQSNVSITLYVRITLYVPICDNACHVILAGFPTLLYILSYCFLRIQWINNKQGSTKHTQKTKDRATRTTPKIGGELRFQLIKTDIQTLLI
jgi:hypothetical protein